MTLHEDHESMEFHCITSHSYMEYLRIINELYWIVYSADFSGFK